MRGICGFTSFSEKLENSEHVLSLMMDKLKHRGLDVCETFIDGNISVGLCGSSEILHDEIAVLLDGELENASELRKLLNSRGYEFTDFSDVRLLSCLYHEYGCEMLNHIQGLFALVIYDFAKNLLFAARDRVGAKPLHYSFLNDEILFASEIKGLLEHPGIKTELNEQALEQYLAFQYSVLPETFFKGIYRLLPSEYLIFKDGKIKRAKYWEAKFEPKETDFDETVTDIENAVINAINPYKSSEEEIGSFLSSGVDSSFIAACYKPKKCFTVGYTNGNYSEIDYAKTIADHLGIQHITKLISADEYFQALPKAMYYMDEPLADPAAIAFYFGCEEAAKHVKIAFSGEGPDEFFGGYGQYFEPYALDKISFVPMKIRRVISRMLERLPFSVKGMGYLIRAGKTVEERFIGNANIFNARERRAILKSYTGVLPESVTTPLYDKVKTCDDVTKMQFIDISLWMAGDILHQADRMSLAHSLLIKTPYLNKKIIDIALGLPVKYRVTKSKNKIAFRAAAMKHLTEDVAQKKKLGFPVPLRVWLKEDKFYNFTKKHFESKTAEKFFHPSELNKLLERHKKGSADNSRKIWTILIFLIWHQQFFDGGNYETT